MRERIKIAKFISEVLKILSKIERNKVGKREIPSARAHLISEPIKTFLSELVKV
jgi:hypothetical protein